MNGLTTDQLQFLEFRTIKVIQPGGQPAETKVNKVLELLYMGFTFDYIELNEATGFNLLSTTDIQATDSELTLDDVIREGNRLASYQGDPQKIGIKMRGYLIDAISNPELTATYEGQMIDKRPHGKGVQNGRNQEMEGV